LDDHFTLFGLPQRFTLDASELERTYKEVQAKVHPDRFGAAQPSQKRVAMQWATRANDAYATLRVPLRRAVYLCALRGEPVNAESNTAMPAAFMMQQMQWREALDEATHPYDPVRVGQLQTQLNDRIAVIQDQVQTAIDQDGNMQKAANLVRQWMFMDRFAQDVQQAIYLAEDAVTQSGSILK